MPKFSWLAQVRHRLQASKRRAPTEQRLLAESLEQRTYLSVSSLLVDNHLTIVADSDEALQIRLDPANAANVQLLVNGVSNNSLPTVRASQLQALTILGGQGNNLINVNAITSAAFSYADPVTGQRLQIRVDGGNGEDTLVGSQGFNDSLFGGHGDDQINVAPTMPILVGQTLHGDDGNDLIIGGPGGDTIEAGDGTDSVTGGAGDDVISGGDGNDLLNGSGDNDSIRGGQGLDTILGGVGNDTLVGESGNDSVSGEDGNDSVLGGAGHDRLFGDGGATAVNGDDTVLGNSGDDTILGGGGADMLQGQDGDDLVSVAEAGFSVSDVSIAEGGAGTTTQVTVLVSLSAELAVEASVDVTVVSGTAAVGSDLPTFTQRLVFPAGTSSLPVVISINGDAAVEPNEDFSVMLSNAVGALIQDGQATVTITNDDVPPTPLSNFDIVVNFTGGLSPSQQAIFAQAEARLEQIITGDVPDILIPGVGLIDDVVINASGVVIDGRGGVLGQAGPTGLRPGSFLPYSGDMQFDTADLAALEAAGELDEVILHEMMHVLGFGTIWTFRGLLTGAGTADPRFVGPLATAEFNARFGQTATGVPVEGTTSGPGSADSHWRESIYTNELMTPALNSGVANPLSRSTVAQFADLGYVVNLNASEPYFRASGFLPNAVGTQTPATGSGALRRINVLRTTPIVGLPSAAHPLNFSFWSRSATHTHSHTQTSDGRTANLIEEKFDSDKAAALEQQRANLITTITYDELPAGTVVDNLSFGGVTYDFKVAGRDSVDATYNFGGTGLNTPFLQGGVLEGTASGVLTIDFVTPVSSISFGVARNSGINVNNALTVELFDNNLVSLGMSSVNITVLQGIAQAQYTTSGQTVRRMRLDFSGAPATGGNRFAIDNLIVDDAAVGPPPAIGTATISGGNGNDTLSGGGQNDLLFGNADDDVIAGGGGNDTVFAGGGLDTVFGGDGNDSLLGQVGKDLLLGGSGNDFVNGGDSSDVLYGDDVLGLLTGNDIVVGGAGDDLCVGVRGNDSLLGGAGRDTLNGDDGDDTLDGSGGQDLLNGGAGNDSLNWDGTSDGSDTFDAADGQDGIVIRGTSGADSYSFGQSGSTLQITQGTATLSITPATEALGNLVETVTLNTLAGDDVVVIGDLNLVGFITVVVNGGAGADIITGKDALLGSVNLLLNGEDGNDALTGTNGRDSLIGGAGRDRLRGQGGDDDLSGGLGDDTLDGGDGDDLLEGEAGNDSLTGGSGDDLLSGGDDIDQLLGQDGDDLLFGGFGNDLLIGAAGDDSLEGNGGEDVLLGGLGNDTLDGGRNNDTITGGVGDDKIRGDHGDDSILAGDGNDTIDAGDGNDFVDAGTGDDGVLAGDGDDIVIGGTGLDTILGGDGNDQLIGGADVDLILGGDGDDVLNGNGGGDLLAGNEGRDVINDTGFINVEDFVVTFQLLASLDASS